MAKNGRRYGPGGIERRRDPGRAWRDTGAELSGFAGAEIIAEGVWIGSVLLAGLVPEKLMNRASRVVGKVCIQPFLSPIEGAMSKVCKLDECQPNEAESKDERAEKLARVLLTYVPAILISLEAKVRIRKYFNEKVFHIKPDHPSKALAHDAGILDKVKHYATLGHWTPQEKMIFAVDEATQLGSFLILHNPMAELTADLIKGTSGALQRTFHIKKAKADEYGTATWMWIVPNGLGAVAASTMIAGKHLKDWPAGWVGKALGRHDLGPSHR